MDEIPYNGEIPTEVDGYEYGDSPLNDIISIRVKCARCKGIGNMPGHVGGLEYGTTCPQCEGVGFIIYTQGTKGYTRYLVVAMRLARLQGLRDKLEETKKQARELGLLP